MDINNLEDLKGLISQMPSEEGKKRCFVVIESGNEFDGVISYRVNLGDVSNISLQRQLISLLGSDDHESAVIDKILKGRMRKLENNVVVEASVFSSSKACPAYLSKAVQALQKEIDKRPEYERLP